MNRITHFEIYTDDPEAVRPFYQDVFGWKFNKFDGPMEYWLVTTGSDKTVESMADSLVRAKGKVRAH